MPRPVYYYLHDYYPPETPVRDLRFYRRRPKTGIYLQVDLEAKDCDIEYDPYDKRRAKSFLTDDTRPLAAFPYDVHLPYGTQTRVINELKILTRDEITDLHEHYPVPTLAALPLDKRRELIHRTHDALGDGPWLERLDHLTSPEITERLAVLQRRYQTGLHGIKYD